MFHFNISIGFDDFDARKSLETTVKKFKENAEAERVANELQLRQEKAADEMFSRLCSSIAELADKRVKDVAYSALGNILAVVAKEDEIQVNRTDNGQIEPLLFLFDSLTRGTTIIFNGKNPCHRSIQVVMGKPHLVYRRRPDEPFTPISVNNLPAIVNHSIDNLLGAVTD